MEPIGPQGLSVFPWSGLVRFYDVPERNDLLRNLIKLPLENLHSPEN